jgi:hypothetical protein
MWNRCVLVAIAVLFGGGSCGSSPTAPMPSILAGPGPYRLGMLGYLTPFNPPEVSPCEPVTATVLLSGAVTIDVSKEGALWVGRASPPKGDLVLTIQGGEETSEGIAVSGFVTGMALDNTSPVSAALIRFRDVTMKFGGATGNAAIVKGVAERTGRHLEGTITGDIEFSNAFGDARKCPAITWSLHALPYID